MTALSADRLSAFVPNAAQWTPPPGAEITFGKFPKAPEPAGDEPKRLRQMKDLARQFKAYEFFAIKADDVQKRYELRLLPQQILRYSDEAAGVLDGALFFFVYGNNPEIALLIESQARPGEKPSWNYGMNRIAGAELHVKLGDQEVWTKPRHFVTATTEPYWIFVRPLSQAEE
jgi:hypothetical protein